MNNKLLVDWDEDFLVYDDLKVFVSCVFSGEVINVLVGKILIIFGGFVDFVGLNNIIIKIDGEFIKVILVERNIWFGVCEFVMGVVLNGMVFYGGL